ncbi:unnamed protein product [Phaedon cochleariae]|uniref:K Homology domain-containing protein n=1 Tax=Phaedon cochleariae TaxID=80249 RepID=A0A9P0D998_PHACE|nr:unnamed protein product [Phaedon cochleariae]
MTERYDSNGEYYTDNFKRKASETNYNNDNATGDTEENNQQNQKANEYVKELLAEKLLLDQSKFSNAAKLIDQEVSKVQQLGRVPRDNKYVDIYREKPIKVTVKVLVPVKEHPKFNFVGKLLGPKGNSMKRLQEETMCKMAVLGRGSMKDRNKEEELRTSLDPKYSHLSDDLHVEISALGPPAEAHARVAFALAEVRKYLIPDNNDFIRIEQMREMEIMVGDPHEHPHHEDREMRPRRPPPQMMRSGPPRAAPRAPPPPSMRPSASGGVGGGRPASQPRGVMPAKTKIMSILDRARVAMEESYGYEEEQYEGGAGGYEEYVPRGGGGGGYGMGGGGGGGGHHYVEPEYEGDYYRQSASSYGFRTLYPLLVVTVHKHYNRDFMCHN